MLQLKAGGAPSGACEDFDATVVLGRPEEAAPGILFLHGGPHSAYAASYVHSLAFLASLGYNIVIPNYRYAPCCTRCTSWQRVRGTCMRCLTTHMCRPLQCCSQHDGLGCRVWCQTSGSYTCPMLCCRGGRLPRRSWWEANPSAMFPGNVQGIDRLR